MRIATWNVNSVRKRVDRVLDVLQRHDLDVLALQETKCKTEQFPVEPFREAGYDVAVHGLNQWNGVAVLSRVGISDVTIGFPGQPGFEKGEPEPGGLGFIESPDIEARAIGVRVGEAQGSGLLLWSVYVPNGRGVSDPHYAYKLEFLRRLRAYAADYLEQDPRQDICFVGDWNVVPQDSDVWDPQAFPDGLYMTAPEREAFFALGSAGLTEVTHSRAEGYTFWDYKQLRFPRNEGMRIDFAFANHALAQRVTSVHIDRDERKGKEASDHVPVIIEVAEVEPQE